MEPPDPSFADKFNILQEDAVLVFDVRRAAVSLPFQVHRLKVRVEAGLVAFSSACFEFANEVPNEVQHGSLAHLPKVFSIKHNNCKRQDKLGNSSIFHIGSKIGWVSMKEVYKL